jgi:DNA replication protein DnaD
MGMSAICEKAGTAKITVNNMESANFFIISSILSERLVEWLSQDLYGR